MSPYLDGPGARAPRLIALDWGTSTLRAYLIGDEGAVLEARTEPWGIMRLPPGGYAAAFDGVTGEWRVRGPALPIIASGMVGSAQGWSEAPYCDAPAGAAELARVLAPAGEGRLSIVPGVVQRGDSPNVMRGEETQIVGALAMHPGLAGDAMLVLPGTHSKWVRISRAQIGPFATFMTGELFAVLGTSSILGRPARDAGRPVSEGAEREAFARGVMAARGASEGVAPILFSARSLVLTGQLAAEASLAYLSGLLIGDEIRSGLAGGRPPDALIGDPALCERYLSALALFGVGAVPVIGDAAPAGLWAIAQHASLAGTTRPSAVA